MSRQQTSAYHWVFLFPLILIHKFYSKDKDKYQGHPKELELLRNLTNMFINGIIYSTIMVFIQDKSEY